MIIVPNVFASYANNPKKTQETSPHRKDEIRILTDRITHIVLVKFANKPTHTCHFNTPYLTSSCIQQTIIKKTTDITQLIKLSANSIFDNVLKNSFESLKYL